MRARPSRRRATSDRPSPSSTRSACIHAPCSGAITRARTASRYSVSSTSPYTRSKRSSGKPKLVASSYRRSSIARSAGSACSPLSPFTRSQAAAPAPSSRHAGSREGSSRSRAQRSSMNAPRTRLVSVEGGTPASALVDDVELDLGAVLQIVGEQRGGLQREVPQRVVESSIAHATRFRRRAGLSCLRPGGYARCAGATSGWRQSSDAELLAAVAAHVLDQRDQRPALGGQRVLDPRRHLRVGVPLDDALLLERPQPQRQRPRADAGERALELAEAATALGEIADDEDRPLPADDVRGGADRAAGIASHDADFSARLQEMKWASYAAVRLPSRPAASARRRRVAAGHAALARLHQHPARARRTPSAPTRPSRGR